MNKPMNPELMSKQLVAALLGLLMTAATWAADPVGEPGRDGSKANPLKNVYFGEQHLHTADSADAFISILTPGSGTGGTPG